MWWCIRANWRGSKPKPVLLRQRRKPQPWQHTCTMSRADGFACEADAEAAIAPVWLEKAERIAALAMLTVVGLLVASIMQRQVRLYLRTYDQQLPGNKGPTAIPIAAVVLALFAQVALIQLWVSDHKVAQVYGLQPYHL